MARSECQLRSSHFADVTDANCPNEIMAQFEVTIVLSNVMISSLASTPL
jgi:hypothetical protein